MLGFQGLLAIAPDHDEAEEAADDSAAEEEEDDGDANGPDARREEGLEGMRLVDEGLDGGGQQVLQAAWSVLCCETHEQEGPDGVVEEDGRGDDEHAEANETVELRSCQGESFRSVRRRRRRTVLFAAIADDAFWGRRRGYRIAEGRRCRVVR